jgi:hypothetical protein
MVVENKLNAARLVVTLGMHRSGTSALCRSLLAMGVDLGSNLNPAHETNPKGFWEDLNILEFNENLLATLGMKWHSTSLISSEGMQFNQNAELIDQARDLIRLKVDGSKNKLFGFKEPRTAKLLSFWQKVFQGEPYSVSYLLVYRNPLSVAQSLKKRDGFELTRSYLIWLLHVIPCLSQSVESQRVLVNYDDLLEDPVCIVSGISKQFELSLDAALLHDYATDFLDKELRHTRHTLEDLRLDTTCPELVRKVYSFLEEVRSGEEQLDSEESRIKIQDFVLELRDMAPILQLLDTQYEQKIDLQTRLANQRTEIDRLKVVIENQLQQIGSLGTQLVADQQQLQSLKRDSLVAEEHSRNIKHELLKAEAKFVELKSNLAQETYSLEIAKTELISALQKVDLLLLRCEKTEQQYDLSTKQLASVNETIATYDKWIQQVMRLNKQLQTEHALLTRRLRPKSWFNWISALLNRGLLDRSIVIVSEIDLSEIPLDFNPILYLKLNPDVALAGFEPRRHYILHGKSEARKYKESDG